MRKDVHAIFTTFFFRTYQGNMDRSQIVDFTKISVSVIPHQSVRLNITKKSFGDASISFQPSLTAFPSLFHNV